MLEGPDAGKHVEIDQGATGELNRGIFCSLTLDDIGILTLPAVVTLTLPNGWMHRLKPGASHITLRLPRRCLGGSVLSYCLPGPAP